MYQLENIFRKALGESFTPDDREHWDSLQHIEIIALIEKEFKIKFEISEIIETQNEYLKLEKIIKEKINDD